MIVDLHRTYASLRLIHLVIDIYHLASILRKWIVKWIVVLNNPITCRVLCSAIYVHLIIVHPTFVLWLLHLLLLKSLVVLVLRYDTFTLILYLLLVQTLNHIFIWFLRAFPWLALRLEIYWLIHIISIILLLYWTTLSSSIVVYLLKLLLIYRFWIIMLLILLILIELSFWRKNIISIFFILIEYTLLLLLGLLRYCAIIVFLYEYLVWSWIVLI